MEYLQTCFYVIDNNNNIVKNIRKQRLYTYIIYRVIIQKQQTNRAINPIFQRLKTRINCRLDDEGYSSNEILWKIFLGFNFLKYRL